MSLLGTLGFITNHPLNRAHKLGAMIRFVKWQVGSRVLPGAVVYDWIGGSKFLVKNGETGLTGNIYTGLHEFDDMAFLLHFLRAEDLFVDIGANVGSYSILACSVVGAKGIAFEPIPSTYTRLVENMRLNHLDEKVNCINKGVGEQQGSVVFTSDGDTVNHALASGEQCDNKVVVEVTSLDTALNDETPSLIKIDVEGYETQVLAGAEKTLQKQSLDAVIMELNGSGSRYGFRESKILDVMLGSGFKTYSYNPFNRELVDLQGKNRKSGNTLFIRDRARVESRIRVAPKINVNGNQL